MKLVFTPPNLPPALNGSKGLIRMSIKEKVQIKKYISILILLQKPKKIVGPVSLEMVNYSDQLMDWDNLASRLKVVGDCLVKKGLIEEDNPKIIVDFLPRQVRVYTKAERRLEFIFTPVKINST